MVLDDPKRSADADTATCIFPHTDPNWKHPHTNAGHPDVQPVPPVLRQHTDADYKWLRPHRYKDEDTYCCLRCYGYGYADGIGLKVSDQRDVDKAQWRERTRTRLLLVGLWLSGFVSGLLFLLLIKR